MKVNVKCELHAVKYEPGLGIEDRWGRAVTGEDYLYEMAEKQSDEYNIPFIINYTKTYQRVNPGDIITFHGLHLKDGSDEIVFHKAAHNQEQFDESYSVIPGTEEGVDWKNLRVMTRDELIEYKQWRALYG